MFANASANESEEPEYASLAELEDVGAIFKNSKVYQDYVAKNAKAITTNEPIVDERTQLPSIHVSSTLSATIFLQTKILAV